MMEDTPGIADVRVGREEGRPEIADPRRPPEGRHARHDRRRASPTRSRRTSPAPLPRSTASAATSTRSSSGCAKTDREAISDIGDVLLSTPAGQVVPARNLLAVGREAGPVQIDRKNMERITRVNADIEIPLSEAVDGGPGATRPDPRAAGLLRRLRRRGRRAGAVVPAAPARAGPRGAARLRRDGVAVRVAARPVHHHVLDSGRRHRRRPRACC